MATSWYEKCVIWSHFRSTAATGVGVEGLLPQLATSGSKGKLAVGTRNSRGWWNGGVSEKGGEEQEREGRILVALACTRSESYSLFPSLYSPKIWKSNKRDQLPIWKLLIKDTGAL